MKTLSSAASIIVLSATVGLSAPAIAAVPDDVAARLKGDLTPLGAERGADGLGLIPTWTENREAADLETYPDNPDFAVAPFARDPVLTTITSENAARFSDRLTATHRALLATYPDSYKMPVYRSRRTCQTPDAVNGVAFENATSAELSESGNGVTGATSGTPFPIPNSAYEVIRNHLLAYQGHKVTKQNAMWAPDGDGEPTLSIYGEQYINLWTPEANNPQFQENPRRYIRRAFVSPAKIAGTIFLEHTSPNFGVELSRAWSYFPGTRRVRRAPQAAFGEPMPFTGDLVTYDSQKGFDGSPGLYDWTIVEKASYYLPNNSHRLSSNSLQYENVLSSNHLNQDHARYELQRVWVLEATLKEENKHSYLRRRFYIQEDSWQILATEQYDAKDNLISGQEMFPQYRSDSQLCELAAEATYDVVAGRYAVRELSNQEPRANYSASELDAGRFTPASIRQTQCR
jgi:uncharacterized protein DUF1329